MSLGEDMQKLSLRDGCSKDPIMLGSAEGRLPTFKDVKRSLKVRCTQFYESTTKTLADVDQDVDSSHNSDGSSSKYYFSLSCIPPLIFQGHRASIRYLQSVLLSTDTTNL